MTMPLARPLRRAVFTTAALLAFSSPVLAQGGFNLSWDDCGSFGVASKTFSCGTNVGQDILIGSAVTGVDVPQMYEVQADLLLVSGPPALPSWWQVGVSGCRPFGVSSDIDFTNGPFHCADGWNAPAATVSTFEPNFGGMSNHGRIRVVSAITDDTTRHIDGTVEYEYFKLIVKHSRTVGASACTGCTAGTTIILTLLRLDQPAGVGDLFLTQPLGRAAVDWQTGGVTDTHPSTWGSVKALYR